MYRILIAEPDQTMSLVLSRIIHRFDNDAKIFYAENRKEIIEIGRKEKIQLLFLNLSSRSQSLIETGIQLREIRQDLYICIMSVYDMSYYGKELFDLRINRYLTKPFSGKEVTKVLREFRQQSSYRPGSAARKMISCIEKKDFPGSYERIMPAIMAVAKGSEHDTGLRKDLIQLADYIINIFLGMDQISANDDKYYLKLEWCKESELLKIWLFNIIEYVFQKNSIIKYGILERFFTYIEGNKCNQISLTDISSGCNISQGYLSRIFKSEFNMSVMNYVKLKKIQLVKLNLIFSPYSLSEIATRTGFYDGGHMHRLFQQYEKITIQEFKDITQKSNEQQGGII